MTSKLYYAHPTAILDEGCVIKKNAKIWHFCHVMPGAVIGEGSNLGQNVFVDRDVRIGKKVKIQNNVSVYRGVILEDDVFVGPSAVFTNVKDPRSEFPKAPEDYFKTVIKKGATIGANATIVCGIEIGEYAFIGAGSVVTKNIPSFAMVAGVPAKIRGWLCKCGKKIENLICRSCQRTYSWTNAEKTQLALIQENTTIRPS